MKTILFIAVRRVFFNKLQSLMIICSVAFVTALSCMLFLLSQGLQNGIIRATEPFDILAGKIGSPYQLVLSTVFLQDAPVGNISWSRFEEISADSKVARAIPVCLGDSFSKFPIVGTTDEVFSDWIKISKGRAFEREFEAVVGADIGLKIGDKFQSSHGYGDKHEEEYTVVGIADRQNTPYDRAIFTHLKSFWLSHCSHEKEHEGHGSGDVTVVLVRPKGFSEAYRLMYEFQSDKELQMVLPAQVVVRLFSLMGRGEKFVSFVVWAVFGFTMISTALLLYFAGAARHRERTLLRVLGASPRYLIAVSWLEGSFTIAAGAVIGAVFGRAGFEFAAVALGDTLPISAPFSPEQLLLPLAVIVTGSAVSVLPAIANSGSDMEKILSN